VLRHVRAPGARALRRAVTRDGGHNRVRSRKIAAAERAREAARMRAWRARADARNARCTHAPAAAPVPSASGAHARGAVASWACVGARGRRKSACTAGTEPLRCAALCCVPSRRPRAGQPRRALPPGRGGVHRRPLRLLPCAVPQGTRAARARASRPATALHRGAAAASQTPSLPCPAPFLLSHPLTCFLPTPCSRSLPRSLPLRSHARAAVPHGGAGVPARPVCEGHR
jgi:hypothetical protein